MKVDLKKLRDLAREGVSYAEMGRKLKISTSSAFLLCRRLGITNGQRSGPQAKEIPVDRVVSLRVDKGWTFQRLADKYGVSRQRIHQIVQSALQAGA